MTAKNLARLTLSLAVFFAGVLVLLLQFERITPWQDRTATVQESSSMVRAFEMPEHGLIALRDDMAVALNPESMLCNGDAVLCEAALNALQKMPMDCVKYIKNLDVNPVERGDLTGFTDTYGNVTLSPGDDPDRMVAILVHECGHVMDFFALRGNPKGTVTPFTFRTMLTTEDDPSAEFYDISWVDNETRRESDLGAFASEYATGSPQEDFAETFAAYILHPHRLRLQARDNDMLQAKYDFMDDLLSGESLPATETSGPWDGTVPASTADIASEWVE